MKQEIEKSIKEAMLAKNSKRLIPLRAAKTAMTNLEKSGASVEGDAYPNVIRKLVKQGNDSEKQFRDVGRIELADKEKYEISILEEFLPKEIDELGLREMVKGVIRHFNATSMKDMGKIINNIKESGVVVSGQRLSTMVKQELSK